MCSGQGSEPKHGDVLKVRVADSRCRPTALRLRDDGSRLRDTSSRVAFLVAAPHERGLHDARRNPLGNASGYKHLLDLRQLLPHDVRSHGRGCEGPARPALPHAQTICFPAIFRDPLCKIAIHVLTSVRPSPVFVDSSHLLRAANQSSVVEPLSQKYLAGSKPNPSKPTAARQEPPTSKDITHHVLPRALPTKDNRFCIEAQEALVRCRRRIAADCLLRRT